MKDVLDILGQTLLVATMQPRQSRNGELGFSQRLAGPPARVRIERKADRTRFW